MFGFFKKKKADERFSQPLSPEADRFLAEALEEYGRKEDALEQGWRLSTATEYALNDRTGLFHIRLEDGRAWEADAQILGSFDEADQTWRWAWGDPQCVQMWSRDSKAVRATGKELGIWYVHELPMCPMPGPEFVAYLCAIGMKASGSTGLFEARDGSVVSFVMLKNPRWSTDETSFQSAAATDEAHFQAAAAIQEKQALDLTEGIRLIKAGQSELILAWNKRFALSDVYVIGLERENPDRLLVIGPPNDKNYIAVFTDRAELDKAVGKRRDVLFPRTIKGLALVQQAQTAGRGLIVNPTDEAVSIPLPPHMMSVFLEGLDAV